MKRLFLIASAIALVFVFACKAPPPDNGNLNGNGNRTANSNDSQISYEIEKDVTITFTTNPADPTKCVIAMPVPNPIYLKKNREKIKWCIVYNCQVAQATVVLDDFKDQSNPTKKNPFGDNSDAENTFKIGPLSTGASDCNVKTRVATGEPNIPYKYRIRVTGPNGEVLAEMDPQVIINE